MPAMASCSGWVIQSLYLAFTAVWRATYSHRNALFDGSHASAEEPLFCQGTPVAGEAAPTCPRPGTPTKEKARSPQGRQGLLLVRTGSVGATGCLCGDVEPLALGF